MRRVFLKLPEDYIPVFKKAREKIRQAPSKIIYVYSPPAYGKTTTLLKFFKENNYNPVFIQIEENDKNFNAFKLSLLEVFAAFSSRLSKSLSLIDENTALSFFWSFIERIRRTIELPENTYFVFLDTYRLMENFEKILNEIILPVFDILDVRVVIEANTPFEFKDKIQSIGKRFFTLCEEEIIEIGNLFGQKIDRETAFFIKEKTEGWILPCILFFKDKRNIQQKLKLLEEGGELLAKLLEQNFSVMNEEEKMNLLALGQLREFNYEAIEWILGYQNPKGLIRDIKDRGFVLIEECRGKDIIFKFHHLIKVWLENKISKLPMGIELSYRIHSRAMEYFESVQEFETALYHAIQLKNYIKIGKYFKAIVIDLFCKGKIHEIEKYFNEIGTANISSSKDLTLCYGIYLNFIERYKDSISQLNKILNDLETEDRLLAEYYILGSRVFLGEEKDLLIENAQKLLKKLKEYEKSFKFKPDVEKDSWKIAKRKIIKSPKHFIFLMYGRIYNLLGTLYYYKGKINEAREFYKKSLEFLEKTEDKKLIFIIIYNLGLLELFQGNKKAIDYFETIIKYQEDPIQKASSLHNLGLYYEICEGNLERAEEYYKKAEEINQKFNQTFKLIPNILSLIDIYSKKQEKKKLFEYLKKLEKIVKEINDLQWFSRFCIKKADILIKFNKVDEAEKVLTQLSESEISKSELLGYYRNYTMGKLKYIKGFLEEGKELINESLNWILENDHFANKVEKLLDAYQFYKRFKDKEFLKVREIAGKMLKKQGFIKRLKDFDID